MTPSTTRIPRLLFDGIHEYTKIHSDFIMDRVSVLYIDIVGFSRFGQNHGSDACQNVLEVVSDVLLELLAESLLPWRNLEVLHIWDDGFAILIPQAVDTQEPIRVIHRYVLRAQEVVNHRIGSMGYSTLRLRYGLSQTQSMPNLQPSERLYQLITEAGRIARRHADAIPQYLVEDLHLIMKEKMITSYYQPIMQLQSKTIIGWESLSRGPAGTELEHPAELFKCAERLGYLLELERICRNQSIRKAALHLSEKLFINVSPNILTNAAFAQGETQKVIQEVGLVPERIVFEITEHRAIDDYSAFLKLVNHYRNQGYQIAIDDVGAGYSGLVTLMQVKPDFVKIDMELVRGIDTDSTKQDIVRAILQISEGFSGMVIAEGIETPDELAWLSQCGIHYGQGFLLGRPEARASTG